MISKLFAGALMLGSAAAAQAQPPVRIAPQMQAMPHQPTNLELQQQIQQLTEQVAVLTNRLTALNNHIASISGTLGSVQKTVRELRVPVYSTCNLLYLHAWGPGGPQHAYRNSDYCTGVITEGIANVPPE